MDFETREIRKMELRDRSIKPEGKKKKTSRIARFFIVLLLLLNLSCMSYIAYDKGLVDDVIAYFQKKREQEEKVVEEKLSLEDEQVQTLYSYLLPLKEKLVMTSFSQAGEFSEDEKKALALALLKEEDFTKTEDGSYQLKAVYLEEAVSKILGRDSFIQKEDMKNAYYEKYSNQLEGNFLLSYDALLDSYRVTLESKKEKEMEPFFSKLFSASKKGDQLFLREKVIYTLETETGISIYSDWQLSQILSEVSKEEEILVDDYLEEAGEIVYTFRKVGENYQFISSKIKEKS